MIQKWNSMSLIVRILIGLIVGAVLGLLLPGLSFIKVLGTLFVGALKAIAPLLVFVLVASSLANAKGGGMSRFRTVIFLYMFSTLCAAIVAVLVNFAHPVTLKLSGLDAVAGYSAPGSMSEIIMNLFLGELYRDPVLGRDLRTGAEEGRGGDQTGHGGPGGCGLQRGALGDQLRPLRYSGPGV